MLPVHDLYTTLHNTGYGMTELTCAVIARNYEDSNVKLGSVGKLLAGIETKVGCSQVDTLIRHY